MGHTFPLAMALLLVTSFWYLSKMLVVLLFLLHPGICHFQCSGNMLKLFVDASHLNHSSAKQYAFISFHLLFFFNLGPSCFHTNIFLFITVLLMRKSPELKITRYWQYHCGRAAQGALLAVSSPALCHTVHPFPICHPRLATLPLLLCLSR